MRGYLIVAAMVALAAPVLVAPALVGPALAQRPEFEPKTSSDQVQRYLKALNACDVETVQAIIDPAISAFGVRGQFAQSKSVYIGALQIGCRAGTKMNLQSKILRHDEYGDIALAAVEVSGSVEASGKTTQADLRLTLVLKRDQADGVWRIIHSQTAAAF